MVRKSLVVITCALALLPGAAAVEARGGHQRGGHDRVLPEIRAVMEQERYENSRFGLIVQDARTGRVLQTLNAGEYFLAASTSKLFTITAALETFGADHRFESPVHRTGEIGPDGVLGGNLILVGVGDLTFGGRTLPDGTIAYTNLDHTNANAIDGAELTEPDPLGGFDDLARQIAAAGVTRVAGDVIVDDRLFDTVEPRREELVAPVIVNDNLIDFTIIPGAPGGPASVDWRPQSAAFDVTGNVVTVDAGAPSAIVIEGSVEDGLITVGGQIPADAAPLVKTSTVRQPARLARTLLVEALVRAGVAVDAPAVADNAVDALPDPDAVAALPVVATLVSAPFAEYAKLILKVSHNLGADLQAALIAAENGERTLEDGLIRIGEVLREVGLDTGAMTFASASGLDPNQNTPPTATALLRILAVRPDFDAIFDALPILGVDGSLAMVQTGEPAAGHVRAKTGTGAAADFINARLFLTTEAEAGYIETRSGRFLVYALYVNGVPNPPGSFVIEELLQVSQDLGRIAAILWGRF